MPQDSEIVALLMAFALLPVLRATTKGLTFAGKKTLSAAFLLLTGSWVFTVLETWWFPVQFNFLEHMLLTMSMVCFAWGLTVLARAERRAER